MSLFCHFVARSCRHMSQCCQLSLLALVAGGLFAAPLMAQAPAAAPAAPATKKLIPPEDLALTTKDGLTLKATYFASNVGKEAVPIILLHSAKGSRGDFAGMAGHLQKLGHAVLVPDLRGHGESTVLKNPVTQREIDLNASRFTRNDYARMVDPDMERLKDFLREKNNLGELNLEKLCVVGVELGATVALNWAALDWSWPVLATGKQGQDVKGIVLISPSWQLPGGFVFTDAMNSPAVQQQLSVMLIAGEQNSKSMADAKRLEQAFSRHHPAPPAGEEAAKQDLFFIPVKTSLAGGKMLGESSLNLNALVAQFVDLRLVKKTHAWTERKSVFDSK